VRQPEAWVYDGNSLLGIPISWSKYVRGTFRDPQHVMDRYRCRFRVVTAHDFLDYFASDRSHMLVWDEELQHNRYLSPPPIHPPIVGRAARGSGTTNNLMVDFVDMRGEKGEGKQYGVVMDDQTFCGLTWSRSSSTSGDRLSDAPE